MGNIRKKQTMKNKIMTQDSGELLHIYVCVCMQECKKKKNYKKTQETSLPIKYAFVVKYRKARINTQFFCMQV